MEPRHRFCRYMEDADADFEEAYFLYTVDCLREREPGAGKEYTETLGDATADELEQVLGMVAEENFDDDQLGEQASELAEAIQDKMRDDLWEWSDLLVDFMWLGFGPTSSDYSLRASKRRTAACTCAPPPTGRPAWRSVDAARLAHDSETASAIFREFVRGYTPNLPSMLTNSTEGLIPRRVVWDVYYELTEERGEWLDLLDEVTSKAAEPDHLGRSLNILHDMGSRFGDWDAYQRTRAEEAAELTPEVKRATLDPVFEDCYGE